MRQQARRLESLGKRVVQEGLVETHDDGDEQERVYKETFDSMSPFAWGLTRMTLDIARIVANAFRADCRWTVGEVYCFGSVAREGWGNDLDLIITVDESTWRAFRTSIWEELKNAERVNGCYFGFAGARFGIAYDLLGGPMSLTDPPYCYRESLDIFLFPEGWQGRLNELQQAFPHHDPRFMWNIAADAIPV